MALHPLNQQCEAKAKATGRRCERRVVGGTVCYVHGGNAKQVKVKREQRLLVAEARAAADVEPVVVQRQEPEEVLLDVLADTNAMLQAIKNEMRDNLVNPVLLQLAGEWFDRVARIAKVVTDGDLSQKLHARIGWLAEDRAATVWGHLAAIVEASPLSARQKLTLWESVADGLQLIGDERAPFGCRGMGFAVSLTG